MNILNHEIIIARKEKAKLIKIVEAVDQDNFSIERDIVALKRVIQRFPEMVAELTIALEKLQEERTHNKNECNRMSGRIKILTSRITSYVQSLHTQQRYLSITNSTLRNIDYFKLDRKKGVSLVQLRKSMPTDVLNHIREYLPYNIQFYLLERKYNPIKRFEKLRYDAIHALLTKICLTPHFMASFEMGVSSELLQYTNPAFRSLEDRKPLLMWLIVYMKGQCPKYAIQLMKEMIILVNPRRMHGVKQ
jgi:hypothetical protein